MSGSRAKNLLGRKFGNLTVIARGASLGRNAAWLCRCSCGEEKLVKSDRLIAGLQKSCARNGHYFLTTAQSALRKAHPSEYSSWMSMRHRCSVKHSRNKNYAGRGIAVCERWRVSFENFLSDMGPKPTPRHTIDRKNNDKGYEPGNCRWATRAEQNRNLRRSIIVEHNGERVVLADLVDRLGLNKPVVLGRLRIGWTLEEALSIPVRDNVRRRKKSVVAPTTQPR